MNLISNLSSFSTIAETGNAIPGIYVETFSVDSFNNYTSYRNDLEKRKHAMDSIQGRLPDTVSSIKNSNFKIDKSDSVQCSLCVQRVSALVMFSPGSYHVSCSVRYCRVYISDMDDFTNLTQVISIGLV